ncbi:MAG TPA: hypothetical protein VNN73_13400 [Blastocatellia bacterium]|nr:hypothetical protein [Blastocatellia bacterium]
MQLDITDQEKNYLLEVLEASYHDLMVEINRTDALDYKEMLRHKLNLLDGLRKKLQNVNP